jgi:hypothetical protein
MEARFVVLNEAGGESKPTWPSQIMPSWSVAPMHGNKLLLVEQLLSLIALDLGSWACLKSHRAHNL